MRGSRIAMEEAEKLLEMIEGRTPRESVSMPDALGRVLFEDVTAGVAQPAFDRSPLDGYAVRSMDVKGAQKDNPVSLKVTMHLFAGTKPTGVLGVGEAARIMTGGMIPEGADGVIMQEQTDEGEAVVQIYEAVKRFGNICFQGEDVQKGDLLIEAGTRLNYAHIGIIAGQGMKEVGVYKKPMVAVMATGDELMQPGDELLPGRIYDSNSYLLAARLKELGADAIRMSPGRDDVDGLLAAVERGLEACDMVITSGGVSVGQKDYMPFVAQKLGAELLFHGVMVKPGSPILAMTKDGKPVFCLSGNPFAAAATFEAMVRPVVERFCGSRGWKPLRITGTLEGEFKKSSHIRRLIRANITGDCVRIPTGCHSSGVLGNLAECNCLIDVPAGTGCLEAGSRVDVILL